MTSPRTRPCDEAAIRSTPVAPECLAASRPWVLAVTILASTMAYIDESVVNVALPVIERDLGVPVAVIQWLVNAYTLSLSAFLLIGGAAGDRFGRRRVFIIGTAITADRPTATRTALPMPPSPFRNAPLGNLLLHDSRASRKAAIVGERRRSALAQIRRGPERR